jgi:HlyD family secretion protein
MQNRKLSIVPPDADEARSEAARTHSSSTMPATHSQPDSPPPQPVQSPQKTVTLTRRILGFTPWLVGAVVVGSVIVVGVQSRSQVKINTAEWTVPVQTENLPLRITASGTVEAVQSVNLSPKTAGRLTKLYVEQGDAVRQGQVVAHMDDEQLQTEVAQAQAQVAQAEAKYQKALRNRPEDIAQGQSRLAQANARLAKAKAGNRSEEIAQAQAQVEAARIKFKLSQTNANRYRELAAQRVIAQAELDSKIAEEDGAMAALTEAERKFDQLKNGSRPEDLAATEAEVAESQQALRELQNGSRPEDIALAKAELAEAKSRLKTKQIQLADTQIQAPFAGVVMQKYATEGAFVTPTTSASSSSSATSTSVVQIARGLKVLAKVPEVNIGFLKPGQTVEILADAYPDRTFKGQVQRLAPAAIVEQNVTSFEVTITIQDGLETLKSGMNVRARFLSGAVNDALVIPTVAIATQQGQTGVYVLSAEQQPQFRPVKIGASVGRKTQILDGVTARDRVFTSLPKEFRAKSNMGGPKI